jgi:putative transposase
VGAAFPNPESCLRLIRALAAEIHEGWLDDDRYPNMKLFREHRNEKPRKLEAA